MKKFVIFVGEKTIKAQRFKETYLYNQKNYTSLRK